MGKCQRIVGALVGACLVSCLAIGSLGAETVQGWSLWVSQPSRPGLLTSCSVPRGLAWPQSEALAPAHAPHRLDEALTIRWQGGHLVQAAAQAASVPSQARAWNPLDSCFVLSVRGVVVAAGAVVPRYSARLLRSDTLVLQSDKLDQPLAFSLLPAFPAEIGQPVSPEWRQFLTPISKPMGSMSR